MTTPISLCGFAVSNYYNKVKLSLLEVVDVAHSAWTPKLGARWHASDRSTWFAQYARGFRAPPFGDVNIGLSLALLNYEVRPNPELQPETSAGLEAGWRWQDERLQASVSLRLIKDRKSTRLNSSH